MEYLDPQYTYIVGVSGGCDSMYLLEQLYLRSYSIVVCHVDYGIRHDTIEDYKVVKGYCDQYSIPFYFKQVKAYEKGNFQNQARNIRYDFFSEIGKLYKTNKVVVAHHKDDVYETILLQKQRDIHHLYLGLKKISKVRECEVYRILLDTTKQEILDYCKEHQLQYHDDYTNFQTHYQRDYIRNVVLKQMSQVQKDALLLEANQHNKVLEEKEKYYQNKVKDRINLEDIKEEELDDLLYYMCLPYIPRISTSLIEEMKRCIQNEGNSKIDLPVNFEFIKEYNNIYIQKKQDIEGYCYHIDRLEEMDLGQFQIRFQGHIHEGIGVSEEDFPLTIRPYLSGDRIETKIGYKKVSRVFIDKKIPASLRKKWPIVLNAKGEIILIPHIMKKFSYFNVKNNLFVIEC